MTFSVTLKKLIFLFSYLFSLFNYRSMGILLPPISQVTNTRINMTQHHRNRSLDSALQRIPEVEVSSPNADSENTLCTNSILGHSVCSTTCSSSSAATSSMPPPAIILQSTVTEPTKDVIEKSTTNHHQSTNNQGKRSTHFVAIYNKINKLFYFHRNITKFDEIKYEN